MQSPGKSLEIRPKRMTSPTAWGCARGMGVETSSTQAPNGCNPPKKKPGQRGLGGHLAPRFGCAVAWEILGDQYQAFSQ